MSRPAPLQLHAGARDRRLAVVKYEQDARGFGFPPALFLPMAKDEQPVARSEHPPAVDVLRIHWNLSLTVIAMAMVALVVVLL
jgi:hypothetical protein